MLKTILFRGSHQYYDEFHTAHKFFPIFEYRADVPANSLVVGRYSVLPYYHELEHDLAVKGSILINSYEQHRWIADFDYYEALKEYTPESWICLADTSYNGPFIVKGRTNSRKWEWNNMMYAETRRDALDIAAELAKDSLIGPQGVVYRKYIPLKTYEIGLHGVRFTNEWRLFFYKDKLLSYAYYWSSASDETIKAANLTPDGLAFGKEVAKVVGEHVNFFVLDIAETEKNEWILIEVNDGQMSGLSENDSYTLYGNLKHALG